MKNSLFAAVYLLIAAMPLSTVYASESLSAALSGNASENGIVSESGIFSESGILSEGGDASESNIGSKSDYSYWSAIASNGNGAYDSIVFYIRFDASSSIVRPDKYSNDSVFAAFKAKLEQLNDNVNIFVTSINVTGNASYEGDYSYYRRLGETRAWTTKNYISRTMDIDFDFIHTDVDPWLKIQYRAMLPREELSRLGVTNRNCRIAIIYTSPRHRKAAESNKTAVEKAVVTTPDVKDSEVKKSVVEVPVEKTQEAKTTEQAAVNPVAEVPAIVVVPVVVEPVVEIPAAVEPIVAAVSDTVVVVDSVAMAVDSVAMAVDSVAMAVDSVAMAVDSVAVSVGAVADSVVAMEAADTSDLVAIVAVTAAKARVRDSSLFLGKNCLFKLKTNLVYNAVTVANLAFEAGFYYHWAVDVMVTFSPWKLGSDTRLKTNIIQPEVRYYLKNDFIGHYFGVEGHFGWYNVSLPSGRTRYQDADGKYPLWGAGLVYGCVVPFNPHWGMDFSIGIGYARLRYDCFYNVDNGMKFDEADKNWIGPTKLGFSLYYNF